MVFVLESFIMKNEPPRNNLQCQKDYFEKPRTHKPEIYIDPALDDGVAYAAWGE